MERFVSTAKASSTIRPSRFGGDVELGRARGRSSIGTKSGRNGPAPARCGSQLSASCSNEERVGLGARVPSERYSASTTSTIRASRGCRSRSSSRVRGDCTGVRALSRQKADAPKADVEEDETQIDEDVEESLLKPKETFYSKSFSVTQRIRVANELRMRVETNGARYKVSFETDLSANDLLLHWGLAPSKAAWDEWMTPPERIRPQLTHETVGVCQTRFVKSPASRFGKATLSTMIEGDVKDGYYAINFVLYDKKLDQWLHREQGGFFHVQLPLPPEPEMVTRTITTMEEYEEEVEYEVEMEMSEEEVAELEASIPDVAAVDVEEASISEPIEVSPEPESLTEDPNDAWRRLLRPPKEPQSFKGLDELKALSESLFGRQVSDEDVSKPQPKIEKSEPPTASKDEPEKSPPRTKKVTRTKTLTKVREVQKSFEEALPVKLTEGSWVVTNSIEEKVHNEMEVQYKIGALVEKNPDGGGVRMRIEAEVPWDLKLHWGIVPRGARNDVWALPPEVWRPEGSVVYKDKAVETPMTKFTNPLFGLKTINYAELELGNAPTAIRFVLKEDGGTRWIDLNGDDFVIPMPDAPAPTSQINPTLPQAEDAKNVAAAAAVRAAEMHLDTLDETGFDIDKLVDVTKEEQTDPDRLVFEMEPEGIASTGQREATRTSEKSAVGNGQEILLQGFNWESCRSSAAWYKSVEKLAPTIAELGFTVIWLPPPTDSVSAEGYMPRDYYDLNSRYGTKEELQSCITALHNNGVMVLGDAVLNHRCAHFQGPEGLWNKFGGKLDWDASAIVSDDPNFGGKGHRSDGDFFLAAPNVDHSQPFVKADLEEWMSWLMQEVGYDGWRLDYVRGFWGGHVKDYMEATNPQFAVGEYWDALAYNFDAPEYNQDAHRQRIVNWLNAAGGNAGAFDVTTKGILHAVFERHEYWRLSDKTGKPPGVMGWWPSRAVTFIENHDTGSTQGHWRFPQGKELQGYAYILTHPGTPTIFWDHMFDNNWGHLQQPIRDMIRVRRQCGIHCRSEVKIVKCEQSVYAAVVNENLLMKIGPGEFHADDNWAVVLSGNDFCIWRKKSTSAGAR